MVNPEDFCYDYNADGILDGKLNYGIYEDLGRYGHDGLYYDEAGVHNKHYLYDYLCAQHLIRPNDLIIMDCLTGNRTGPTLPVASIGYSEYSDAPADYILTNAIMASKDSVAIDTVATALAGYQLESIKLLDVAAQNGLGTNDPSRIQLTGYSNFKVHR